MSAHAEDFFHFEYTNTRDDTTKDMNKHSATQLITTFSAVKVAMDLVKQVTLSVHAHAPAASNKCQIMLLWTHILLRAYYRPQRHMRVCTSTLIHFLTAN